MLFAMEELMQQISAQDLKHLQCSPDWSISPPPPAGLRPDWCSGAGVRIPGKLLGISVDEPQRNLQVRVAKLATETSERLGPRIEFAPDEVLVNADYSTPGLWGHDQGGI